MGFWFRAYGEMADILARETCFKPVMTSAGCEFEHPFGY